MSNKHDPMPLPPEEPDAADCCGEGCIRCVYDVYDEARERYQEELAAWRARQTDCMRVEPTQAQIRSLAAR